MIKRRKNVIVSASLACLLAVGTLGCSMSSESSSKAEVSVTDEDGTTTTTTSETSTSASTDDGVTTESSTTTSKTIDANDWTDAWMGSSDKGYDVYYAQAPQGTAQAMIVVYNPETQELISVVGSYEVPEQGVVVITDVADENVSFQLTAEEETEDGAVLDLGDEFGIATLDVCTMDELIDAVQKVDVNGEVFI